MMCMAAIQAVHKWMKLCTIKTSVQWVSSNCTHLTNLLIQIIVWPLQKKNRLIFVKIFTLSINKMALFKYFKVDKCVKEDNSLGTRNARRIFDTSHAVLTDELMPLMMIQNQW